MWYVADFFMLSCCSAAIAVGPLQRSRPGRTAVITGSRYATPTRLSRTSSGSSHRIAERISRVEFAVESQPCQQTSHGRQLVELMSVVLSQRLSPRAQAWKCIGNATPL